MVERVLFPFRGSELGGSHVATFTLAAAIHRRSVVECVVLCPDDTLIMHEAQRQGFRTVGKDPLLTQLMLAAVLGYAMGSYALGYYTPPLPPGEGPEVVPPEYALGRRADEATLGDAALLAAITAEVAANDAGR